MSGDHQTLAESSDNPGSRGAQLQSEIASDLYREVVGTVTGMQGDIDSTYSLRRLIEDATQSYCQALEGEYHDGVRWPPAETLRRGGINSQARSVGDVTPLQSWISPTVRSRCFGVVNAMKALTPTYTLRDFLEAALSEFVADLKVRHSGQGWVPVDRLRRGPPRKRPT